MTIAYSPDGQNILSLHDDSFRGHWVPEGDRDVRFMAASIGNGFFPLVHAERPTDTDTEVYEYSVTREADTFVEHWTPRPPTVEEQKRRVAVRNEEAIRAAALEALDANRAFLKIASPSNPQLAKQIKALTQQNTGLIRLVLGVLDAVD